MLQGQAFCKHAIKHKFSKKATKGSYVIHNTIAIPHATSNLIFFSSRETKIHLKSNINELKSFSLFMLLNVYQVNNLGIMLFLLLLKLTLKKKIDQHFFVEKKC